MKLANKVKNMLIKFAESELDVWEKDDGYHKINITEPEFGHIVVDIKEHGAEVRNDKEVI